MPRGSPRKQPIVSAPEEAYFGLYLFGTVIDRTRRTITTKNNNSTTEIVTYTVQDATTGRRYYIDEYSPEE